MAEIKTIYGSIIKGENPKRIDLEVHFMNIINEEREEMIIEEKSILNLLNGNKIVCSFIPNAFENFNTTQLLKLDLKDKIVFHEQSNYYPQLFHEAPEFCERLPQIVEYNSPINDHFININSKDFKSISSNNKIGTYNEIFILNNNHLYGPFKLEKGSLIPHKGKNVYQFEYIPPLNISINKDTSVYIGNLKEWIKEIDCMSTEQIIDFCKEIINLDVKHRETINDFKKISAQIIEDGSFLHQTRVKRIKKLVDHINFTQSEIEDIAKQKSVWNEIFSDIYQKQKELFNNAFREQLNSEITSINARKEVTEKALEDAVKRLAEIQQYIAQKEIDVNRIKKKEQDLIDNIKIQANIIGSSTTQSSNPFFERIVSTKPIASNAIELIESNDLTQEEIERNLFHEIIPKEVYYTNNISATLNILKILNDYCYYLVNVEIDWIKYESLFENGLKQIVSEACNNKDRIHFLILNDFNVANIEFYGKPLIDVITKVRSFIPGTNQPLPDNLKFILVETSCENEEENFPTRCQSIKAYSVELDEILVINDLNRLQKKIKGEALFNWNELK